MEIEKLILRNLITNSEYTKKVLPFIKDEYFENHEDRALFNTIQNFILNYGTLPSKDSLQIDIESAKNLSDEQVRNLRNTIAELIDHDIENSDKWLIDETEKFCQDKAIYLSMIESLSIIKGESKDKTKGAIPKLLSDALAVSFDTNIGHDYLEQSNDRFDYYHRVEERLPFDLDFFNKITKGGVPNKTLNVILAGTGVGKTLFMCHLSAGYLLQGKNVLYITLEMSEEEISKRIDANLLNISIDELTMISKESYTKRIDQLKLKTAGKLIVKQYPTATASVNNFRALLSELQLKKGFKPDVVVIDYINLCLSARIRMGRSNTYEYIKAIAEELRGLSVEEGIRLWTATQTNREGFTSSDVGLENTAESFGLPATADFMFALMSDEELEKLHQLLVKQLKNRYNTITKTKRFMIGIDGDRMRLYDVEQSAQEDITDSGQEKEIPQKPKKSGKKFLDFEV